MSADVVAACRQEIDRRRPLAEDEGLLGYVAALDAFTAILDEHPRDGTYGWCRICDTVNPYPCPTVQAVAGALGVAVDGQS